MHFVFYEEGIQLPARDFFSLLETVREAQSLNGCFTIIESLL